MSDSIRSIEDLIEKEWGSKVSDRIPNLTTGKEGAILFLIQLEFVAKEKAYDRFLSEEEKDAIRISVREQCKDMKEGPYEISQNGLKYLGG